jgi:glycerol-3-phosphate dehydrogenase
VEEFSRRTRERNLERLASEDYDVLVVGGGITGAGVALDAVTRGLKVALVERADFASGTSSKSSRFVHGGLRYLAHGELRLVAESLHERAHLRRMAPHLVKPLPFVIPIARDAPRAVPPAMSAAMALYDVLGGRRLNGPRARATPEEVAKRSPAVDASRLKDAHVYWEATVDDARLTLSVVLTAARHGAVVANYCGVTALTDDGAECDGLRIRARCVVNATGVWSDELRGTAEPQVRPAKGVHIAVPRALVPGDVALMFPLEGGRFVFTSPWGPVTFVGTTDTDYDGPLDSPQPEESEIADLLDRVNPWLGEPLERRDVIGAYAGLRPLAARRKGPTADLSRRHRLDVAGRLVTITGGKLTTWRRMAVDTVDAVARVLGEPLPHTRTTTLTLVGAERAQRVRELALDTPLLDGLPYVEGDVVYAARHEMALTVDDVLARRTRASVETRDGGRSAAARIEELLHA